MSETGSGMKIKVPRLLLSQSAGRPAACCREAPLTTGVVELLDADHFNYNTVVQYE